MFKNVLAALLALGISTCCRAQLVADTLHIYTHGDYDLYKYLYVYHSPGRVPLNFVLDSTTAHDFKKLNPKKVYYDINSTKNDFWLFSVIANHLPGDETFYYTLNRPGFYTAEIYIKTNNEKWHLSTYSGRNIPFSFDNINNDVDFGVLAHSGEVLTVLVHINNEYEREAFFLPELRDSASHQAHLYWYYITLSIITGILFTAFLLNVFLGISLKENIHNLYALYILCILFEIFNLEGIATNVLDRLHNIRLTEMTVYIIPPLCAVLISRIMQLYLQQNRKNSKLTIWVNIFNCILITVAVLDLIDFIFYIGSQFKRAVTVIMCLALGTQTLLVVLSAVEKAVQKYKPAWFYLAATLFLMVGLVEYIIAFLGVNDIALIRGIHPNHMQLGLVAETLMVFMGIIYRYNLYKRQREQLLVEANNHQQELISKIVEAQEIERKRIAEDLHDDVGAVLNALFLHLDSRIKDQRDERSLALSKKAIEDVRIIAHNMLPEDFSPESLFILFEERIADLNRQGHIVFSLVTLGDISDIDGTFAITIYRIANELLFNIVKHSGATEASLQLLFFESKMQLIAEDNGEGFDTSVRGEGIGLRNIMGRVEFLNGKIHVESNSNGTYIDIEIPVRHGVKRAKD